MELTSKEFEILLCEFCKQDLPPNFQVTHDISDVGDESGNKRQIDTKITGRLGISNILICGEAKNWSEKVGSETIDGLVGKYLSGEIRANKVVVFSMQGFTKPAIKRAEKLGIELLEPQHIGSPIQLIPHIIGVGYLGQMIVKVAHKSPQENLMAIDVDDYIILKGDERISFQQMVMRHVVSNLKRIPEITPQTDISKVELVDKNVLYELKQKERFRYNADFVVEVALTWTYHSKNLPTGVILHLNSGETKFVNLQGNIDEVVRTVLMSSSKETFENKEHLIENVIHHSLAHKFHLCFTDPDRNMTHPSEPRFSLIR